MKFGWKRLTHARLLSLTATIPAILFKLYIFVGWLMLRLLSVSMRSMSTTSSVSWQISQEPSASSLQWLRSPKKVLVCKKYNDTRAREAMAKICEYLQSGGAEVVLDCQDPDVKLDAESCDLTDVDLVV